MTGKSLVSHLFVLGLLCVPAITGAAIVPDCNGPTCDFGKFMQLVINVINFLLKIAIPIFAVVFMWAGFLMVTAGGKSGQRDKAKELMTKAFIGFIAALAAFLMVKFVVTLLLDTKNQGKVEQFIDL
jgi:hypothetical protein